MSAATGSDDPLAGCRILEDPSVISTIDKIVRGDVFAQQFADAIRDLLNTPMSDPGHRDAVIKCRALLVCWDDEPRAGIPT